MNYLRLYFKVQDYEKWKNVFDEDRRDLLAQQGVTKYSLFKLPDSQNELSLYLDVKDARKFKDFVNSDIAKNRMKEAGIIGTPEIVLLEKVEENPVNVPKAA